MTRTEVTLMRREAEDQQNAYAETGIALPDAVYLEAQAMKTLSELICYEWDTVDMDSDEQQDLYFALYGLRSLIATHAEHMQQLDELDQ